MKIKVCGITRTEEAENLAKLDIDYMGFIFAKSRRKLLKEEARQLIDIIKSINNGIRVVGVFVNEKYDKLMEIKNYCNLDVVQLHGNESYEYCKAAKYAGVEVWKTFSVDNDFNKAVFYQYDVSAFLLDAKGKSRGGNGTSFDWNIVKGAGEKNKLVLAGGLNKNNVLTAIELVRPSIVDVNSGVEVNGIKDAQLVKEFISTVNKTL